MDSSVNGYHGIPVDSSVNGIPVDSGVNMGYQWDTSG